jgi:nitroreductase
VVLRSRSGAPGSCSEARASRCRTLIRGSDTGAAPWPPLSDFDDRLYNTAKRKKKAPAGVAELLEFEKDVRLLIRERTSIRSYRRVPLPESRRRALSEACDRLRAGPLGTPCRFLLLDRRSESGTGNSKEGDLAGESLGTYGVIRGARTYLAGAAVGGPFDLLDFGYLFELLVLRATDLGLGTCWLGGTYRRSDFARALKLQRGELLPAVSPVGIPARRRSLVDRLFRLGAGSKTRRPRQDLFFDRAGGPLEPQREPEAYREAIEAVRLAPSASNRQPWRIVHDEGGFHFFLDRTPGYLRSTRVDLQRLDIGIAMAHFELALRAAGPESGAASRWAVLDPPPGGLFLQRQASGFHRPEYMVSWRTKG